VTSPKAVTIDNDPNLFIPSEGRCRATTRAWRYWWISRLSRMVAPMAQSRPKSILASIVGWLIAALLVYWLLGVVLGTIRFMVRFLVWIAVVAFLVVTYVRLKAED
jgi:hypothetical protein